MLDSAVSSRTPTDVQPRSHMGAGVWPAMKRQAEAGVHMGWPYSAVGMQRALESPIGFPSRSTSASRMLGFLTPPDVRRSFTLPPGVIAAGENVLGAYGSVRGPDWQASENSSAPAGSSLPSSREI